VNDADAARFHEAFRRLVAILPRDRPRDKDLQLVEGSYFRLLRSYMIEDVIEAGATLASTCTRFPPAAEWLNVMRDKKPANQAHCRVMTEAEALVYRNRATRRVPCSCPACIAAGVSHLPIEFVPIVVDGREERANDPATGNSVPILEEIHGERLRRWYEEFRNFTATPITPSRETRRRQNVTRAVTAHYERPDADEAAAGARKMLEEIDTDLQRREAAAAAAAKKSVAGDEAGDEEGKLIQFKRRINRELRKASSG